MKAVPEKPDKVWTYHDYVSLDDGVYFQIIDGKALNSPAPELFHQRWARGIFLAIERHVEARQLGEVFFALVDVVLDDKNIVQPDLVFGLRFRLFTGRRLSRQPA